MRTWLLMLLSAASLASSQEWIATRDPRGPSWHQLVRGPVETFGPDDRFALVRGEMPRGRGILAVQPNFVYRALDGDPDFAKSWGLQDSHGADIGAVDAWKLHDGDGQTIVAVLDSGIDVNHEELRDQLWRNVDEIPANGVDDDGDGFIDDIRGWNFVAANGDVADDNDHGTFCAGIIGARPNNAKGSRGVIGNVRLMPLKVLDSQGIGSSARSIAAVTYAVKHGARILSASYGGPSYDAAFYDTVKWAGEQGALFVVAAGNDAKDNDTDPHPVYPASFELPNVLTVAAYDADNHLAPFSNYGKRHVHLGAPGVSIYSTARGGYHWGEGTSYAAPFVAGAAALLHSYVPSLDAVGLKERLLATSEIAGYYEKEHTATGGRLNLYNALRDFRPPRPPPVAHWEGVAQTMETEHPYANNAVKVWTIEAPGAHHVRVHFARFETEPSLDKITLRDGRGTVVAQYSGTLGQFWSADALGDKLRVEFTADYSNVGYGVTIDRYESSNEESGWESLLARSPLRIF